MQIPWPKDVILRYVGLKSWLDAVKASLEEALLTDDAEGEVVLTVRAMDTTGGLKNGEPIISTVESWAYVVLEITEPNGESHSTSEPYTRAAARVQAERLRRCGVEVEVRPMKVRALSA